MYNNRYNGKGRGYPDVSLMGRKYAVVLGGVVKYLYGTSASAPVFAGTYLNSVCIYAQA